MPHAHYGIDLSKVPDTYIEPFTAYRAWNWTSEGVTSLNSALWTPKVAFEATCNYGDDDLPRFDHRVPDPDCTCGMYAGINMQHMIDIGYIERGIHGEVSLWGRLMRHTLGWRAQFAYPKFFIVPANMVPVGVEEAMKRLETLVAFDVDIYLQPEQDAKVGQVNIPLWIREYGYSVQGTEFLIEKWQKWSSKKLAERMLKVGDRVAVMSSLGGGIGVVKAIEGEEVRYVLFNATVYHKKLKDVVWNERNWRWETSGLGMGRKI